jgi:hypothetical protein
MTAPPADVRHTLVPGADHLTLLPTVAEDVVRRLVSRAGH